MYLGTLHFYQISARLDFKYGRQVAILENQLRAIDAKLCTYVPIGKSNSQTNFRFSQLGHQGAKTKNTKSAVSPELMARSSQNFYQRYIK
jgi:hypothetical protein